MGRKICLMISLILLMFALGDSAAYGQTPKREKIPWKLTVVVMDGTDRRSRAEIPVNEAVAFIEARTRFVFIVDYVVDPKPHGYTPYRSGRDRNRDGLGDDVAYVMLGWNVPDSLIQSLPVSSSYLFLYKLKGRKPAQAGSALGLDFGLKKGGKPRPYATVPTDMWWYKNEPSQGFRGGAAQIVTHEIINTIQAKIEAAPYKCGQLKATAGIRSDRYEAQRLAGITEKCYLSLGDNMDYGK